MKRSAPIFLSMLMFSSQAHACGMAFPAYGVYSGGAVTFTQFFTVSFFLVLGGAILLKSVAYGLWAKGNFWKLFGGMVLANLVTTLVGYIMELMHQTMLVLVLLPLLAAYPIIRNAVNALEPTGFFNVFGNLRPQVVARCLGLLFFLNEFLGMGTTGNPNGTDWGFRYVFAWIALAITLVVTTGTELEILTKLNRAKTPNEPMDYRPVLQSNLLVFVVLFMTATGVLFYRGDIQYLLQ